MFWLNGRRQTAHGCKNQLLNASSNSRSWEMIIAVHLSYTFIGLWNLNSHSSDLASLIGLIAHHINSFSVSASHLLSPGIWWWLVTCWHADMLTCWHHLSSAKHIWSGAILSWAEETDTVWRNSGDTRSAKWCTNSRHKTSGHPAGGPS